MYLQQMVDWELKSQLYHKSYAGTNETNDSFSKRKWQRFSVCTKIFMTSYFNLKSAKQKLQQTTF